jgi:type IV pilus assembly protein PilO
LPRIVTLHDVNITSARGAAPGQLQMDVVARTYRYLDPDELAAKAAEQNAANNKRRQR